ncbi:MAG: PilZ domain-containing protein [Acidobacteriota bacterium]
MSNPPANERHYPRIENLNLVQINRFDEEGFSADLATGRTLDISQGGIRLELYHPLPLRTVVSLTLALGDTLIEVQGKVVYLEEIDDERCALGMQFIDIPDASQRLLDDYVAQVTSPE